MEETLYVTCPVCQGTGQVINDKAVRLEFSLPCTNPECRLRRVVPIRKSSEPPSSSRDADSQTMTASGSTSSMTPLKQSPTGTTNGKEFAAMTIEEARSKRVCRICGLPVRAPFTMNYGEEFAHTDCLPLTGGSDEDSETEHVW
jgi:hypothetical protein